MHADIMPEQDGVVLHEEDGRRKLARLDGVEPYTNVNKGNRRQVPGFQVYQKLVYDGPALKMVYDGPALGL